MHGPETVCAVRRQALSAATVRRLVILASCASGAPRPTFESPDRLTSAGAINFRR